MRGFQWNTFRKKKLVIIKFSLLLIIPITLHNTFLIDNPTLNTAFLFDSLNLVLIFISISIGYLTICAFDRQKFFLFLITIIRLVFFLRQTVLILYIRYEIVILPLIALIILEGWYSERLYATLVILAYTLIFRLPGIVVILIFDGSWIRNILLTSTNNFINFWLALMFLVKLPIWGVHYWLPLAHVEAPTSGRIILAGILLKLGGYGLIRFNVLISTKFIIFLITGLVISTLACCLQLDIKRTIAYSSVSHIILIPILLTQNTDTSFKIINIILFSHGFSSMALFYLVGIIYKCTNTRNLLLLKGLFYTHPTLVFVFIIFLIMRVNMPPFIGFVREVFRFLCILTISNFFIIPIVIYFILRLVYITNIFSTILLPSIKSSVTYSIARIKENILLFWIFRLNITFIFLLEIF